MAIAKFMARDAELLTAGADRDGQELPQWEVTQLLLEHVDMAFSQRGRCTWSRPTWNNSFLSRLSTDCLRHWAPNGQCYYSDMAHWEGCTAEALDPHEYAAQCISMLQVADAARRSVESAGLASGIVLSAHNVDADPAVSWGTHANVSITTELWEDLFRNQRRPAVLGFVASGIAAAIAWFGSGLVLRMRDGSAVYSLSARAHHLSRLISLSTTEAYQRGILNSRREPHGDGQERLHLIGFDYGIVSAALKCSFLQCLLAAAEEGYCGLNLYDPGRALRRWSWGLDQQSGRLLGEAAMTDGQSTTLPAYIRALATLFLRMVEEGLIKDDIAPHAASLLAKTVELTRHADEADIPSLASNLDWAAKFMLLRSACSEPGVQLGDAETVVLDQDYLNTDPGRGHFWQLWESELVDPMVARARVEECLWDGPAESRAWARGRILQRFHDDVTDVNWRSIELRRSQDRWQARLKIDLPELESLNRSEFEDTIERAQSVEHLEALLDEGAALEADPLMEPRLQGSGESHNDS